MCINLFNSLLSIDNMDEIPNKISSIDNGNEICELFDLVLTEVVNSLDEYKQKEKNHLKDFFSLVSEYESNEIYLLNCGWILAALSDELCERIINNINQQVSEFVILESKISKDVLKLYLNCIKGLNSNSFNTIVNKNLLKKVNNICSKFSNKDIIIETYIDDIYNMESFKTLFEFKFKENYNNEDKKLINIKSKLKENWQETLDIGINIIASAIPSGKEGAKDGVICATIQNTPKLLNHGIQLVKNSWEKMKVQYNNDKKNSIIAIEDSIEYAYLIRDALNEAGEIIDGIEQYSKALKKLKRNGRTKLKNLELLVPNFDFNKKNDVKILKENTDIIKEILKTLV